MVILKRKSKIFYNFSSWLVFSAKLRKMLCRFISHSLFLCLSYPFPRVVLESILWLIRLLYGLLASQGTRSKQLLHYEFVRFNLPRIRNLQYLSPKTSDWIKLTFNSLGLSVKMLLLQQNTLKATAYQKQCTALHISQIFKIQSCCALMALVPKATKKQKFQKFQTWKKKFSI